MTESKAADEFGWCGRGCWRRWAGRAGPRIRRRPSINVLGRPPPAGLLGVAYTRMVLCSKYRWAHGTMKISSVLPLSQNTSHSRKFRTDCPERKIIMFTPIYYSYLTVIDFYMHFLNRIK